MENRFEIDTNGFWINNSLDGHCYDYLLGEALGVLLSLMEVSTVVDLGCGPGWYVKTLRNKGFRAGGFDGNPFTEKISREILQDGTCCEQLDLTEDFEFEEPVDLILSLEVGEHIPAKHEDTFIQNLIRNSKNYIILSWALEGQEGDGHINCRMNDYIINKMVSSGFVENIPAKNFLRQNSSLFWFRKTIMVFQRVTIPNSL